MLTLGGNFTTFVGWVMVNNNSYMTVTLVDEDITCSTPNPEPSQLPPPLCTEIMLEPSVDAEPEPVAMNEPVVRTEPTIVLEAEPNLKSDQVCELAISSVPVSVLVDGMEPHPHSRS